MKSLLPILGFAALSFAQEYDWQLPKGFPKPYVPPDNPMSSEKVELGRYLFYDVRMSLNGKTSCATCHRQELAFTDGRPGAVGSTGEKHTRSSMGLVNIAYAGALTWNNPTIKSLEEQALVPMFGEHPVELGLPKGGPEFLALLRSDPRYRTLVEAAFPTESDPFTIANAVKAIACFERTIISARSPYDRYHYYREEDAVSEAAKRGEILFFDSRHSCFRCHGGFLFSDATVTAENPAREIEFHNDGLAIDKPEDAGKFKTPTLRNIAITAPYMHDGRFATLDTVLTHYASAGTDNPNKDHLVHGFQLSPGDRADLIAFLQSLTDEAVLDDPRFRNPW